LRIVLPVYRGKGGKTKRRGGKRTDPTCCKLALVLCRWGERKGKKKKLRRRGDLTVNDPPPLLTSLKGGREGVKEKRRGEKKGAVGDPTSTLVRPKREKEKKSVHQEEERRGDGPPIPAISSSL